MKTVKQAAEFFNVCEQTVRRWIRDGDLGALHLGDVVRVSDAHIAAFVAEHEATNAKA